jgi:hypothetical protein
MAVSGNPLEVCFAFGMPNEPDFQRIKAKHQRNYVIDDSRLYLRLCSRAPGPETALAILL